MSPLHRCEMKGLPHDKNLLARPVRVAAATGHDVRTGPAAMAALIQRQGLDGLG